MNYEWNDYCASDKLKNASHIGMVKANSPDIIKRTYKLFHNVLSWKKINNTTFRFYYPYTGFCDVGDKFYIFDSRRENVGIFVNQSENITFENEDGKKVRNSNIEKTFNMPVSKEDLINEFKRQNKIRQQQSEQQQYTDTTITNADTDSFIRQLQVNEAMSRATERERQLEEQARINAERATERLAEREHNSFHLSR